jgi:hypothetical protein
MTGCALGNDAVVVTATDARNLGRPIILSLAK